MGCRVSAGAARRFRYRVAFALLLLLPVARPHAASAFGPPGHAGIYLKAWELLGAPPLDASTQKMFARAAYYPDSNVRYVFNPGNDPTLIWLKERIDALNSADHYFDPQAPHLLAGAWVVSPAEIDKVFDLPVTALPKFKKIADGLHLLYTAGLALTPGNVREFGGAQGARQLGADGVGYNAVTAILFLLNGRDQLADTSSNPTQGTVPHGFVPLIRGVGEKAHVDAMVLLGCAAHYTGDLFSPGHTEWTSWWQEVFAADRKVTIPGLGEVNLPLTRPCHTDYDYLGDSFFTATDEIRKSHFWADTQVGEQRGNFRKALARARPRLILSYGSDPNCLGVQVCKGFGGTGGILEKATPYPKGFWQMSLPKALRAEADKSRAIWEHRGDFTDKAKARQFAVTQFPARMTEAVATTAGLIDWAYSASAKADSPYPRDATNFVGMAAGLIEDGSHDAAVTDERLKSLAGSLNWIDRDDYFVISAGATKITLTVKGEGALAGVQALTVSRAAGAGLARKTLAEEKPFATTRDGTKVTLNLNNPPRKFLLRIYRQGGKGDVTYRAQAPASYDITDLGEPMYTSGDSGVPIVNNRGHVILRRKGEEAGIWNGRTVTQFAPKMWPYWLNDRDVVCASGPGINIRKKYGRAWYNSPTSMAYTLSGRSQTKLPTGSHNQTIARGINNAGQIAGTAMTRNDPRVPTHAVARAVLWENGRMTDLNVGGRYSYGSALNGSGDVVGYYTRGGDDATGFLWRKGKALTRIVAPGGAKCLPQSVNDDCTVVGYHRAGTRRKRAFLWQSGKMTDLPSLGGADSVAWQVNRRGDIAGWARLTNGQMHAALWVDGKIADLNDLAAAAAKGWVLLEARSINDRGQIAGLGLFNGQRRYFLATPAAP